MECYTATKKNKILFGNIMGEPVGQVKLSLNTFLEFAFFTLTLHTSIFEVVIALSISNLE